MGMLCILHIFMLALLHTVELSTSIDTVYVSVLDHGAIGNGDTNDSQAFLEAWKSVCSSDQAPYVNLIIPGGHTFLVNPLTFEGPCKPKNVGFQVYGTIKSPETVNTWDGLDARQWLVFHAVKGLAVDGDGIIDGQGWNWWASTCKTKPGQGCTTRQPTAITFYSCEDTYLSNLHFVNSANTHIHINNCYLFRVNNVDINSPANSPNTDGIHIQNSKHIFVSDTRISCGDDCISISDHTTNIAISNINCGPGHGISIGSLGRGGSVVQVEDIYVRNVNFYKSSNGVRIKTWQGGKGYARRITFEQLIFNSVHNPIVIDQNYFSKGVCSPDGVKISNVTYRGAMGSSSTKFAIQLNCSQSVACTGIILDSIILSAGDKILPFSGELTEMGNVHALRHHNVKTKLFSSCINAFGIARGVIQPDVPCLNHE